MSTFLRLKNPIGPTYDIDEDDTLLTKHLLADVGSFDIPQYGITKWPDEPLFSGVRAFQKQNGLQNGLDVDACSCPADRPKKG